MGLKIRKILACIFGLTFAITAHNQKLNNLKIENFQSSAGLINNHVLCTYQDSRGIIWIGTYSGVQTFDGYNFDLFNTNSEGKDLFSNHVIHSIAEDRDHNMWFGTEFGLNKYDITTGKVTQIVSGGGDKNGLSSNHIREILIDDDGLLWLGTYGGGITVYDEKNQTFEQYLADQNDSNSIQSNLINSLYIDKTGLLWVATENGGISVFDRQKRKVIKNYLAEKGGINDNIINCIFQDYYDNYWFGTWNNGLIRYNPDSNTFKYFKNFSGRNTNNKTTVRWIEQTEKDFLWIGTFGEGLYKFYINEDKYFKVELLQTDSKNTKQDYIWKLSKDNDNNLWINTFGSGVFMINKDRNTFPAYTLRDKKTNTRISISCFLEMDKGELWIGTFKSGIYIFTPGSGSYSKLNSDPRLDNEINCLYRDSRNRIWIGIENGLFMIMPDRKSYRFYSPDPNNKNSLSRSSVNSIVEDNDGNIWIGFWGEGINILQKKELEKTNTKSVIFDKYYSTPKRTIFPNNNIWKLFKDSRGNIWIATSDILTYYTPRTQTFNSVNLYSISSFYENESGNIWVTSMGSGLHLLDSYYKVVKSFDPKDGLPSTALVGVMPDNRGRLWVGSDKGISVIEPDKNYIINFDKNYGLDFNEVNMNANILLKSGKMIYGGNEGFNIFSPEVVGMDLFDGKIYINDIKVLYKSLKNTNDSTIIRKPLINGIDTLILNYDEKVITLSFSAINFSNPQGIKYTYRLEGFDNDWILTDSKNRLATYTNLPPGNYLFRVRASYNAKNWGTQQAELFICIKKPIWQRIWFKVLLIVLIVILLYLILQLRLNHEKRELILQNQVLSSEKLRKEQEILRLQNEKLNESLNENSKKIASLAFNNLTSSEKIKMIYYNLREMEEKVSSENKWKLKQTIKALEQHPEEFLKDDSDFGSTVNLLFDDFQKRLSENYPKLTHKDLRICSYIRMNKSNKEIAQQLNITAGSLETSRYRLRKKLELDADTNLNDFLIRF